MTAWLLWVLEYSGGALWQQYKAVLPVEQDMCCLLNYNHEEMQQLQLPSLKVQLNEWVDVLYHVQSGAVAKLKHAVAKLLYRQRTWQTLVCEVQVLFDGASHMRTSYVFSQVNCHASIYVLEYTCADWVGCVATCAPLFVTMFVTDHTTFVSLQCHCTASNTSVQGMCYFCTCNASTHVRPFECITGLQLCWHALQQEAHVQSEWSAHLHNTYLSSATGRLSHLSLSSTLSLSLWANALVRSRTFSEDVNGECVTLMVPFADLANHSFHNNSTFTMSRDNKRCE